VSLLESFENTKHAPALGRCGGEAQMEFAGKRVTVMGLGVFGGGVGVTRFLAGAGARVTVTDLRSAEELAPSLEQLRDLDVTLHLGGHTASDFTDTDLVVVNPAVPPHAPFYRLAERHGTPLETETNLFFRRCPAPIVGVTGSNTGWERCVPRMWSCWNCRVSNWNAWPGSAAARRWPSC